MQELNRALETLAGSARVMHADASDEQNKAEDQYDTRGLETAYLASSQARSGDRDRTGAGAIPVAQTTEVYPAEMPIDLTALVELESRGARDVLFSRPERRRHRGQSRRRGNPGHHPRIPLGKELVGKKTGDRIKLQTRGPAQEFHIVSVR